MKQLHARIIWRGDWVCSDQVDDEKLGPVMESFEADAAHEPVQEPRVVVGPNSRRKKTLFLSVRWRQLKRMSLTMARNEKYTKPLRSA
jgi:hypothetical protein